MRSETKTENETSANGAHLSNGLKAKTYYDNDADLNLLKGKKIVILGYGSQGHAQALNLKDSNLDVLVSVRPGGRGWKLAEKHGWIAGKNLASNNVEAVKQADWIHFLLPSALVRSEP